MKTKKKTDTGAVKPKPFELVKLTAEDIDKIRCKAYKFLLP